MRTSRTSHTPTPYRIVAAALAVLVPATLTAQTPTIPAGTTVYGELDEVVSSKKKETTVGDIVRARVWRDVLVDGRVLIAGGAPMVARVSLVKSAKIAGRKGEVHVEAVSARAVDGTEVLLDGGYDKSGRGNQALAWSLFALVAWPLIFIKGKNAFLEPGTVFDAAVQSDVAVAVDSQTPFRLRLNDRDDQLSVAVLYDELDPDRKMDHLPMSLHWCGTEATSAAVTSVNGQPIDEISVALAARVDTGTCHESRASVELKTLAKHFTKGINRFDVALGPQRAEVVLDIEL